jgi:xylulokinase
MSYLLGIDAGTTMVKAALFDEDRGAVADASVDCTVSFSDEHRAEIDMGLYWEACIKCINEISKKEKIHFKDIEAISISSQGVTFVPIDRYGRELRKGIFYYDTRAVSEARALIEHFGEDKIYEVTGQPAVSAQLEAAKLMWIHRNEPDCYKEIYKILLVHDYLAYKFTGKCVCVQPVISSSLLFDLRQKRWWGEILDFIGLSEEKLPDIYKPGDPIGPITKEVSGETGISSDAQVVAGAIDQVCGMLGIGNTHSGILSESTGSVLAIHMVSDDIFNRQDAGVYNFCNAVADTYALISVCPSAGTTLNWFKETFCEKEKEEAQNKGVDIFDLLLKKAEKIDAGSEGLIMLPHLAGMGSPSPNMSAKGMFYGFRLHHKKPHFVRSLVESIAYMLKSNIDVFKNSGLEIEGIRSFGGGSKSRIWNQIKADVCGLPVITSNFHEPGCQGAAVLAGVGSGIYKNIEDGCRRLISLGKPVCPDQENLKRYEQGYEEYLKLSTAVEPLFA